MQRSWSKGKQRSPAQRREILEEYRQGCLTQKQFAAEVGIGVSTLCLWLRKAANAPVSSRSQLVRLPNLLSPSPAAALYRFEFAGGLVLEVRPGFRPDELGALLKAVRAL